MRRHFKCFKTAQNAGLKYSRIDVVGVRDVGGELSGEVETISVEVKAGTEPFATASGQALGYRVYANRVYLADVREGAFSPPEVEIASYLGVGLIRISNRGCKEELSSPYYKPITRMNLLLLERLGLGTCQLCGSFFVTTRDPKKNWFSELSRKNLQTAAARRKGLLFWNREVADRKDRLGVRLLGDYESYERRFICPDCITHVFADLVQ